MEKYNHYISLRYFCSVALELERIGLRSTSSPLIGVLNDLLMNVEFEKREKNIETYNEKIKRILIHIIRLEID